MELFPIKSVIVTRSSWAEKLQIVVSPRSYFLRTKLGWSLSAPIRSVLSQKAATGSSRSFICVSLLILLETPNSGGFDKLSPIWAVFVTKSSCAEQSQAFVSPCQYFLRHPTRVELGSYPLLELLLSQEFLSGAFVGYCFSSSILPETGQLSTIWAVIVTRSSFSELSQVDISSVLYFMRPQPMWSLAAIPYLSRYWPRKSCADKLQIVVSPRRSIEHPTGVRLSAPIRGVIVTGSSCAEQSQVVISSVRHFLRPQHGV